MRTRAEARSLRAMRVSHRLQKIRAVHEDVVYSMSVAEPSRAATPDEITKAYKAAEKERKRQWNRYVLEGLMTRQERIEGLGHAVWTQIAPGLGLLYSRGLRYE